MRKLVIALMGCCLLAAPAAQAAKAAKAAKAPKVAKVAKAAKAAKEGKAPKAPKALKGAAAFEALDSVQVSAEGMERIAFVPPNPRPGVSKKAPQQAVDSATSLLKEEGFNVVAVPEVRSALAKSKIKPPKCKDDAKCLARMAKAVDAGLVANLVIEKANKQFLLKLMVFDSAEGKAVATAVSMVPALTETALSEAMKKQVPRAVASINRHLDKVAAARKAEGAAQAKAEPAAPSPLVAPQAVAQAAQPVAAGAAAAPQAAVQAAQNTAQAAPAAAATIAKAEAPKAEVAKTPNVPAISTQPASPSQLAVASVGQPTELGFQAKPRSKVVPTVLAGVGTAGLAVGGVFGLMAMKNYSDFYKKQQPSLWDAKAAAHLRSLKHNAIISTVGTVTGALCLAASTGVLMMPERKTSDGRTYTVAPTGNGMAVAGSF